MNLNPAQIVFRAFDRILHLSEAETKEIGKSIKIPKISKQIVLDLCDQTIEVMKKTSPTQLITIEMPTFVIGDLHGNLHDLIRIFSVIKNKYEEKYLFLGDFVDRGSFSLEICLILFALKVQYPSQFFMIRGNHEFATVNSKYGFLQEIESTYNDVEVFNKINQVFSYLPLAAILVKTCNEKCNIQNSNVSLDNIAYSLINSDEFVNETGRYFCVHGGISPYLKTFGDITKLPMPIDGLSDKLVIDLVWSDPERRVPYFVANPRGVGFLYGEKAVNSFLQANQASLIIRAHEQLLQGVRYESRVLTVFSTSGYSSNNNLGGFCQVLSDGQIFSYIYQCRDSPKRDEAQFYVYTPPQLGKIVSNITTFYSLATYLSNSTGRIRSARLKNQPRICKLNKFKFLSSRAEF